MILNGEKIAQHDSIPNFSLDPILLVLPSHDVHDMIINQEWKHELISFRHRSSSLLNDMRIFMCSTLLFSAHSEFFTFFLYFFRFVASIKSLDTILKTEKCQSSSFCLYIHVKLTVELYHDFRFEHNPRPINICVWLER